MLPKQNSTALITGASSGLGYQYALALGKNRCSTLVLTARRKERLEKLKSEIIAAWQQSSKGNNQEPEIFIFPADLSRYQEREMLFDCIASAGLEVDFLVNNAGFGSVGRYINSNQDWELKMLEVNCAAPLHLCRYYLPKMCRKRRGVIINVCSTAAYQPMPYMATYAASKAFLLHFSVALAVECKNSNVLVTAHCPGPTETEFHIALGLEKKIHYLFTANSEEVVAQALQAIDSQRSIVVNGWTNLALSQINRLLPKTWAAMLVEIALRPYADRKL